MGVIVPSKVIQIILVAGGLPGRSLISLDKRYSSFVFLFIKKLRLGHRILDTEVKLNGSVVKLVLGGMMKRNCDINPSFYPA